MSAVQWPDLSFGPVNLWTMPAAWKLTRGAPCVAKPPPVRAQETARAPKVAQFGSPE